MLLQLRQMIANQSRGQAIAFPSGCNLSQEAFTHVASATSNRIQTHHRCARFLDQLFRPSAQRRNFLVGRVQASFGVEIADDAFGNFAKRAFDRIHVKLPLEMVSQRWRPGQELFERGRIFLVFEFLGLVSRIEIILKLPAEIYLFKSIARTLVSGIFLAYFGGGCYFVTPNAHVSVVLNIRSGGDFDISCAVGRRFAKLGHIRLDRGNLKTAGLFATS